MASAVGSYEEFHRARFSYLLSQMTRFCPDRQLEVLDVGRSVLTTKILGYYANVSTLGFPLPDNASFDAVGVDGTLRPVGSHTIFDLNDAQSCSIALERRFDIVVLAEVIEHLYTAPELVLAALKKLLRPGGLMFVQTPNATALYKRLLMLWGLNPYEKIRTNPLNPGHFREYTKAELIAYMDAVGLETVSHRYKDYFSIEQEGRAFLLIQRALSYLVPSFARGQTLIARNPL